MFNINCILLTPLNVLIIHYLMYEVRLFIFLSLFNSFELLLPCSFFCAVLGRFQFRRLCRVEW
jgi:hypothetical protein